MQTPQDTAQTISDAMELFNAEKYDEVITFASGSNDPALLLLAARSYARTGNLETAENILCGLIKTMPDSSYLHGYLATVYEKQNRLGKALEEYATALTQDPDNKTALRSFAGALLTRGDLRAAIPPLRALVRLDNKAEDIRLLMHTLTEIGEPGEAVALHIANFGEIGWNKEFIEALIASKDYQKALNVALPAWQATNDTAYLRLDLEALGALDTEAAESAYRSALDSFEEENLEDENVSSIRFSFILLEKLLGNYEAALFELSELLKSSDDPVFRMLEAELQSRLDNGEEANLIFRRLITDLCSKDAVDYETAELVIDRFAAFLSAVHSKEEVAGIISVILSPYQTPVCLVKIGEAYEAAGALSQAKDWYYRAYRADYIRGGLAYARFLKRAGHIRECETVIRYMTTNTSDVVEVERIADVVLNGTEGLYQLTKAKELVLKKLAQVSVHLSSAGREMLCAGYLYSGLDALERQDYEECKWYCLAGIDMLPCYPDKITVQDFTDVLARAKGRALVERPVLVDKEAEAQAAAAAAAAAGADGDAVEIDMDEFDEREQKAIAFIKEHREATEMDLRSVLETRRVAGIMNAVLAKTAEMGISLIEKRGVGDRGEVYGYIGS
ncbi:MAG TPA: hypothetical protein O0X70_03915 [Methanocorpusculum sp.]|nr:hypothetical protein [Methanocorpusculum sp.]